jgi:DNA polymerase-1
LIDGKNLLFRVGHSFRDLTCVDSDTKQEVSVGAIYGFLRVLTSIHKNWGGVVIICWECQRADNFRRDIFPEYKAKESNDIEVEYWVDSLRIQMERLQGMLTILGVRQAYSERHEADDVMATLATRMSGPGRTVVIYTNDADLLQAVQPNVLLVQPKRKGEDVWDVERIRAEYEIEPGQFLDIKSLTGCNSDNVPGVRGIGEKRALELIYEFGSVNSVLEASLDCDDHKLKRILGMVRDSHEIIKRARKLVKLHDDVKLLWLPRERDVPKFKDEILRRWKFNHFASPSKMYDLTQLGG